LFLTCVAAFAQTPAPMPELKPGLYAFFVTDKGEFTAELYDVTC
jgi:hypothetical protein